MSRIRRERTLRSQRGATWVSVLEGCGHGTDGQCMVGLRAAGLE